MVRRLGMAVTVLVLMHMAIGIVAGHGVARAAAQDITCADFNNPDAAQALLEADDTFEDALDPDGDGEACTDDDLEELEDQQSQDDEENQSNQDDEEDSASNQSPLAGRFGSPREDFEAEYGEPVSDEPDDYPVGYEYEVDGYRRVNVFYHKDYVAYITAVAERRSPFSQSEAEDVALTFLPADFEQDGRPTETEDGDLLIAGHSQALERRFGASTYNAYGATGDKGDVFFILRLNADSEVTSVEIGLGTEETTGPQSDDDQDEDNQDEVTPEADDDDSGDSGDTAAYQAAVCEQVGTLTQSIQDFFTLIADPNFGSDESIDQLATILVSWAGATDEANSLDVPSGEDSTQESLLEFTDLLVQASGNVLIGIQSGDETALGTAADQLTQASALGNNLLASC